jgi:4a-hydroxytetrahydrobiopterin dehydratase
VPFSWQEEFETASLFSATRLILPNEKRIKIMPALTTKQISLRLKAVPDWAQRAHTIGRTFKFEDFLKSIDFVNRLAKKAQKLNHHPDIDIRFDQVTLKLTTHDQGGITEKDFTLAKQCDEVFTQFFRLVKQP